MRELILRQKLFKVFDQYEVKDDAGEVRYQVKQKFSLWTKRFKVWDAEGHEVFALKKLHFHIFPHFRCRLASGEELTLKSKWSPMRRRLQVDSDAGTVQVKGNLLDYNYHINVDGDRIGEIRRKFLSIGDSFVLSVKDQAAEPLVLAIALVLDVLVDGEKEAEKEKTSSED